MNTSFTHFACKSHELLSSHIPLLDRVWSKFPHAMGNHLQWKFFWGCEPQGRGLLEEGVGKRIGHKIGVKLYCRERNQCAIKVGGRWSVFLHEMV